MRQWGKNTKQRELFKIWERWKMDQGSKEQKEMCVGNKKEYL